jgi:hypothetical protein
MLLTSSIFSISFTFGRLSLYRVHLSSSLFPSHTSSGDSLFIGCKMSWKKAVWIKFWLNEYVRSGHDQWGVSRMSPVQWEGESRCWESVHCRALLSTYDLLARSHGQFICHADLKVKKENGLYLVTVNGEHVVWRASIWIHFYKNLFEVKNQGDLKGTLTRDFRPLVFFLPLGPWDTG